MPDPPSYRLAALLQDIGCIQARASGEEGVDRTGIAEQSATFVRDQIGDEIAAELIESRYLDGVQIPEGQRRERAVLDAATALVSGEGDVEGSAIRLRSVFAALDTAPSPRDHSSGRTYPLQPLALTRDTLFPRKEHPTEESEPDQYATLWAGLADELPSDPRYETLVNVLEKYTWCVPSDRGNTTDLPLFDQLRTTAAVSDALADSDLATDTLGDIAAGESDSREPLYTLVKGDLSGIQGFIHRLRNPDEAQDRIAKRTRGRSIQLWLLNEGLARLFCARLDLPPTSLLWRGGGQFYALVPPGREADLNAFETEVNDWLFDRFDGDLFFVQGATTATDPATEFSVLFQRAANQTEQNKLRKGAATISKLDTAVMSEPREPCSACGGELTGAADRCANCRIQEAIGQALPRTDYLHLAYETNGDKDEDDEVRNEDDEIGDDDDKTGDRDDEDGDDTAAAAADFTIDLAEGGLSWWLTADPDGPGDVVYALNSTDLPMTDAARGFMFTGAAVPAGGQVNRVWSFVELQQLGRGTADLMHVGKMDIDSLGEAIGTSMEGGPARLAALSRALEVFFSGYVNRLAQQRAVYHPTAECDSCQDILADGTAQPVDHSRGDEPAVSSTYYRVPADAATALHERCVETVSPVYIAFSGGDDMLFVGSWDEAIDFAQDVRSAFDAYTSGLLTLSGGFYLTQPKYPIGRATEQAEERLDAAKQFESAGTRKNAATMFSETLAWDRPDGVGMNDLLTLGRRFEELITEEELPKSLLHAFLDIQTGLYPSDRPAHDISQGKQKEWKIKYLLARNIDSALMEELEDTVPAAMPWMRVPVSWASLATR